ncbi:MAG: zinc ribbon domain-containing protein [Bacteroidia bacterium]|jgi:predicted  nucleic acid-binding Zn-ribbon protein
MSKSKGAVLEKEASVEEKLKALYSLQQIDSAIDRIRIVQGELPLEVSDLEDEVAGLETRIKNLTDEINTLEDQITARKIAMKDATELIKKYEGQQGKVRNNREYDSITKEIEYQSLDIQLSEKRIKEFKAQIAAKNEVLDAAKATYNERKNDLDHKKDELKDIVAETEKEEKSLLKKSKDSEGSIEPRLLNAYQRIRSNSRNGLGVVTVERDACGGCFNKIPPQTQMDIRTHKKIIVCEHCGRILVDAEILNQ